nr:uncharacterized protein C7orf31 homolog isoform X3 [Columba livia]
MVTAHCMEQEEAQIRTMMLLHDQPHYHRETEGTEILSRTYESNEVLTPLQIPSRPTVSQDRYTEFRKSLHCCELPCGAEREHGGITLPALPEDHRAKDKSPCTFVKRHQHYGSGVFPWPRSLPTDQYYVTQLKKSDVRMNDELLRKPPDSSAKPLCLPFPSSHPFQTHISRYAVFPNFRSPEDRDTGVYASSHQPFHPNIPTKPFDVVVLGKTRGNAYRHEVVSIPSDSQKKAVCWPGQHGYFQLPKFAKEKSQIYYPKPPKTVAPNSTVNELEHNFSARTTNMLRNTERALGITTYHRDFTGRGPMNPLILDNYYLKEVGRLTGEVGDDVELNLHVSLHGDQRTGQERQHCLNASPAGRLLGARQHCWSCSIPSLRQQHTNVFMIPSEERQKTSQITLLVEGDTHSMVSILFISLTDILAL